MKILGIDSSAVSASAALTEDGKIISEAFVNIGLTHSQTLLTLVDNVLHSAGTAISDIDLIACVSGPGSFTGVRIGISLAKGLALPYSIPCIPISTLEAIAFAFKDIKGIICPVMDARCAQVYTALFESEKDALRRLTEDSAIKIAQLNDELKNHSDVPVYLAGDGTEVALSGLEEISNVVCANQLVRYQRASCAALLAEEKILNTDMTPIAPEFLCPFYLREPQAVRNKKDNNR